MSYRISRWGACEGSNRGRGASRHFLSILVIYVFFITLSPTFANGTVIEKEKKSLIQAMTETTRSMCLKQLEGGPTFWMLLRVEVKPIGPGSNRVHLAGDVEIPEDLLQVGSGWSRLRYEYTSVDKDLVLKVWLNDEELPYKATRSMYSGRYELNAVKMYMMGRMEMLDGDDCPQPPSTTEYPATTNVMVTSSPPPNPVQPAVIDEPSHPVVRNPESPAVNTPAIPAEPILEAGTHSWIWAMGAVGSVPTLVVLLLVVVILVVVAVPAVILWRRKNSGKRQATNTPSKKSYDPSGCNDSLMRAHQQSTNGGDSASNPQEAQFSSTDTRYNPMYRPPASPNYYN